MSEELFIAWTTCDNEDIAERLAQEMVERDLAACVQIDPIRSFYMFEGDLNDHTECRLTVKFAAAKLKALEGYLNANHPNEVPEWVVVRAESVGRKYLDWAQG